MEIKAQLNKLSIAPRKVRLVADLIRRLPVTAAETQLRYFNKRSAAPLLKLLRSAVATAEHNYHLDRTKLFIKRIQVNEGMTLKRWQPKAMGRATILRKRSSKVTITLGYGEKD